MLLEHGQDIGYFRIACKTLKLSLMTYEPLQPLMSQNRKLFLLN